MSLIEPSAGWRLAHECIQPSGLTVSWSVDAVEIIGSANANLMAAVRDVTWPAYTATLAHAGSAPLVGARMLAMQCRTAGHDRQGHPWDGDYGLTFSIVCAFAGEPAQLGGLSLVVGMTMAEAVAGYAGAHGGSGQTSGFKWLSDVQITGRKLVSILVETVRTVPGRTWTIINIGLSLERPHVLETTFGRDLSGMEELVDVPGADAMFPTLLISLGEHPQCFGLQGLMPFAAPSAVRNASAGGHARLWQNDSVVLRGVAHGISAQSRLAIESGGHVQWVHSGEVFSHSADAERS